MRYWFVCSPFKTREWEDILIADVFNLYGIRSHAAKKNILTMEKGDKAFWYSSTAEKKVYGTMKIKDKAFSDNTGEEKWLAINFIPETSFKNQVT